MNKIFQKLKARGTNHDMDLELVQSIEFQNVSFLLSIISAAFLSAFFYFTGLRVACFAYGIAILHFTISYLFYKNLDFELVSFITSCLIMSINTFVFTYYGITYGFQYILIFSIVISLINTKKAQYRKLIYLIIVILFFLSSAFLLIYGPQYPPFKHGALLNLFMLGIALAFTYQFSENYIVLLQQFESQKHTRVKILENRNEEIKSFNHSVAHDLKEPLRTIASFSGLLYNNVSSEKKEESKVFNEYITKGVDRMSKLLEDLMAYIETSDKKTLDTNVDLNLSVNNAKANLLQRIKEQNAKIILSELPIIRSNQSYCTLLFQNFISNAIKFVEQGTNPVVEIKSKQVDGGFQISISDNGIGIPKEKQSEIFSAFNRIYSKDIYEGSGLGLSLCKKIVGFWQGKIDIDSELGAGTTFKIFIPNEVVVNKQVA